MWNIPRTVLAAAEPHAPDGSIDPLTQHPVLVFDVDGILAFTSEALCGALNASFGTSYSPMSQGFFPGTFLAARLPGDQARWVSGILREPAFLGAIAPDMHALDVLRDAEDAGFDCVIATERAPQMQAVTAGWLNDWGLPDVEVHAVGHGNKPRWMAERFGQEHPAVLVDDNPAAVVTIARPGTEVWYPSRPYSPEYTRPHSREFASWAQARRWLGLGPEF